MGSNFIQAEQSKFWRSFVQPSTQEAEEISSGGLDFAIHDTPASAPQDLSQAFPAYQKCFRAPVEAEVARWTSEVEQKRIIICCDGTWQSSTTGVKNIPSNITRLYRSIARTGKDETGKVFQQIAHYSAGIGTGDLSFIEKERQGAFGIGLTGDVIDAYNFIVNNYSPGDQIFCFGFSRGAYTARALAGLVTDIGIIQPREMQDFPDLYDKYRTHQNSHTFRQDRLYREWITGVRTKDGNPGKYDFMGARWDSLPHTLPDERSRVVEVVGVFDTVGSLGIPNFTLTRMARNAAEKIAPILGIHDSGFHNHQLSPFIEHAFHALALDERRKPFTPTLWWLAEDKERNPPKPEKLAEDLAQEFMDAQANLSSTDEQLKTICEEHIAAAMFEQLKEINSELLQVWFPGVHINVGGGNPNIITGGDSDFEQIALISFAWMCERIRPYLQLVDDREDYIKPTCGLAEREHRQRQILIEDSRVVKDYGSFWPTQYAWWALDVAGIYKAPWRRLPKLPRFGWALGTIVDSFSGAMRLAHAKSRTPGCYRDENHNIRQTNEQIHPSVYFRMLQCPDFDPPGLRRFQGQKS
ncbi:hypotheticall protein [Colletotrichum fructicola]|nr:hypotheticall protein [Colletotrichum fructicola]KAF4936801.1 hypotheticall protein [Colletotrichum fructicola]